MVVVIVVVVVVVVLSTVLLSSQNNKFLTKCNYIDVNSFLVFRTKVTVNIGLKEVVKMVTSILLIICICYKPERIRIFLSFPTTQAKSVWVCKYKF